MSESRPRLYSGDPQHENFSRMEHFYPTRELNASPRPLAFPIGMPFELPTQFSFVGEKRNSGAFLRSTDTTALLILQHGELRYEQYHLTGGREVPWTSWSMAKSFVSALVGVAIAEGMIGSIDDAVDQYLPTIGTSAYAGVSIRHILQMSSGADWNEDYSDPQSDVNRLGPVMAGQGSLKEFVQGIRPAVKPGTLCQYNSADTQVLGLLLASVTGLSLTEYMQQKLCDPLGFEHRGYWLLDTQGTEMALGGLNLTARDFAKIGELYRNGGRWRGSQLVSESWVKASVQSDADHLKQGQVIVGGHVFPLGYGYQWWIPEGDEGEFSAIGVYNQFIYVNPTRGTVIVKLSANRDYGTTTQEHSNREQETVAFLRAVNAGFEAR